MSDGKHVSEPAPLPEPQLCTECPMCRTALSAASIAGVCSSCPLYHLKDGCCIDLIACPECGYHSLPQEHGRALGGNGGPPAGDPAQAAEVTEQHSMESLEVAECSGALPLSEVAAGTRVRLLGYSGIEDNHLGRLTAYGLLPGVSVEVLQRFPAIILAVYHAELALETGLAEGVWVLPED